MTSLQTEVKQNHGDSGYFINVADIRGTIYGYNPTAGAATFSTAVWAIATAAVPYYSPFLQSSLALAGGAVLKDMGKTVVSSLRTFRKVQLVTSTNSLVKGGTEGVGGVDVAPTNYITGYIELPGTHGYSSGSGSYTPVARLG